MTNPSETNWTADPVGGELRPGVYTEPLENIQAEGDALTEVIRTLTLENDRLREQIVRLSADYQRAIKLAMRLAGMPADLVPGIEDKEVEAAQKAARATIESLRGATP